MLNQKFITTFKCIVIHLVREGKKDSCWTLLGGFRKSSQAGTFRPDEMITE